MLLVGLNVTVVRRYLTFSHSWAAEDDTREPQKVATIADVRALSWIWNARSQLKSED